MRDKGDMKIVEEVSPNFLHKNYATRLQVSVRWYIDNNNNSIAEVEEVLYTLARYILFKNGVDVKEVMNILLLLNYLLLLYQDP